MTARPPLRPTSRPGPAPLLAALLLGLATLFTSAAPATAHASLNATTPADGSTVDSVEMVTLEFNENVDVAAGGVRVFDAEGERRDLGQPRNTGPREVAVDVDPALDDGPAIVTWRVVSADGHPIRGAFVFSVGEDAEADEALVAQLFASGGDTAIGITASIVRVVGYGGTLLLGGALAYLLLVATDDRERDRARRWARRGAIPAVVAAVLVVPIQAMAVTGFGPVQALSPDVLLPVAGSSVGISAGVRLIGLTALHLLLARATARPLATGIAGAVTVLSFTIAGHTRTVEPLWLMVTADVVHLVTAAIWFGGLVVLVAALRDRSFDDAPVAAADLVSRYSRLATTSVVAVTLAGSAMSWALVRQPRALFSTTYGWTLAAKLVLAIVVIGIGVVNNRRLVPAVARAVPPVPAGGSADTTAVRAPEPASAGDSNGIPRAGWRILQRTTRVEVVVMAAVIAVTGVLVNLRPAAEAAGITGIYEVTETVTDELTLNMVVDPNRAGANEIHLYLLDPTGRPTAAVEQVELRLSLPERDLGPIERETFVAGPGHWQLNGSELSLPGRWTIEVVIRVDRFTEETVTVPVVVNPA